MNSDLVVGVMSLLTATIAFYVCVKVKELVDVQKTMTLLALLAPACEDQKAWADLVKYLIQQKRLGSCDLTDEKDLAKLFRRLGVKIDVHENRLEEAIPTE